MYTCWMAVTALGPWITTYSAAGLSTPSMPLLSVHAFRAVGFGWAEEDKDGSGVSLGFVRADRCLQPFMDAAARSSAPRVPLR